MTVYISHEAADLDVARQLIDFYAVLRLEVLSLSPAEQQSQDRIRLAEQLIKRADLALYVISRQSLHSTTQGSEIRAAAGLGTAIVPIVVGDLTDAELPPELKAYRMLRLGGTGQVSGLLAELAEVERPLRERSTTAVTETPPKKAPPPLTMTEQVLALARVDRISAENRASATLTVEPGDGPAARGGQVFGQPLGDPDDMTEARRLARSLGQILGHAAVLGGLIALAYVYWDKLAALFGSFSVHKGSVAALTAAKAHSGVRKRLRDNVECCVFAPPHVRPRERIQVQVPFFKHDEIEEVIEEAQRKDPTAVQKQDSHVHILRMNIRRGSKLTVSIDGNGLVPHQSEQTVTWRGNYCFCEFWLDVPDGNVGWTYKPEIKVFLGSGYIGSIVFRMPCVPTGQQVSPGPSGDDSRGAEPIFISYAHEDFREVKKVADSWLALGLSFFHDSFHLLPGDNFPDVIDSKIDRSRTFYLFWTHSAKKSAWVKREYDRALARRNSSELRLPVIITYGIATRQYPWPARKTIPDGTGFLEEGTHIKLPLDRHRIVGDAWMVSLPRTLGRKIAEWRKPS